jgi:hypothetical protein
MVWGEVTVHSEGREAGGIAYKQACKTRNGTDPPHLLIPIPQ